MDSQEPDHLVPETEHAIGVAVAETITRIAPDEIASPAALTTRGALRVMLQTNELPPQIETWLAMAEADYVQLPKGYEGISLEHYLAIVMWSRHIFDDRGEQKAIFKLVTASMVSSDRTNSYQCRFFVSLLSEGLSFLPRKNGRVFREVKHINLLRKATGKYTKGNTIHFRPFTATSRTNLLDEYAAEIRQGQVMTIFVMEIQSGKVVGDLSAYAHESEVLLEPYTYHKVTKTKEIRNCAIIYLQEVDRPHDSPEMPDQLSGFRNAAYLYNVSLTRGDPALRDHAIRQLETGTRNRVLPCMIWSQWRDAAIGYRAADASATLLGVAFKHEQGWIWGCCSGYSQLLAGNWTQRDNALTYIANLCFPTKFALYNGNQRVTVDTLPPVRDLLYCEGFVVLRSNALQFHERRQLKVFLALVASAELLRKLNQELQSYGRKRGSMFHHHGRSGESRVKDLLRTCVAQCSSFYEFPELVEKVIQDMHNRGGWHKSSANPRIVNALLEMRASFFFCVTGREKAADFPFNYSPRKSDLERLETDLKNLFEQWLAFATGLVTAA